jgi:hypothetical protein
MNSERLPPARKPRRGAKGRVKGDGALAQGKAATALGRGARQAGRDIYEITTVFPLAAAPDDAAELRQAYLAWLVTQANRLPLFVSDSGKMVQLPSVYTALLTKGRDEKRFASRRPHAAASASPAGPAGRSRAPVGARSARPRATSGADGRTGERQDDLSSTSSRCAWPASSCACRPPT